MCLVKHHTIQMHDREEVHLYAFLTSESDRGDWSPSYPCHFTAGAPLERRLGGPQSQSGHCEEKISCPCQELIPSSHPSSPQPGTILAITAPDAVSTSSYKVQLNPKLKNVTASTCGVLSSISGKCFLLKSLCDWLMLTA
jgi:hypothetical protein